MIRDFIKYQSLGNDFIIIDWFKKPDSYLMSMLAQPTWSGWVKQVCDRHYGVGADGVLIVRGNVLSGIPEVIVYNADGSVGQTCLNGLRTVAHHLATKRSAPLQLKIKMGERLFSCDLQQPVKDAVVAVVVTELDVPSLQGSLKVTVADRDFIGINVSVGNPHFVILESVDDIKLNHYGSLLESHKAFPSRTNVEFLWQDITKERTYFLRVFERGCGVTLACSSGAAAAMWVLNTEGLVQPQEKITIAMSGGNLTVWIAGEKMFLEAQSQEVFSGIFAVRN